MKFCCEQLDRSYPTRLVKPLTLLTHLLSFNLTTNNIKYNTQIAELKSDEASSKVFNDRYEKLSMSLIFLHGSGCSSIVWEQQLSFFNNGLALNLPGHPDGNALNDVSDLSEWLVNFIEKRNLSDVVLVGHSLGSAVALQTALLGEVNVKALVLIGAGARLKVIPQLLDSLAGLVESDGQIPDFLLSANQKIAEPLRTKINSSIKENGASVMLNDFSACDKFDVMEHLADINIPVQIIVGDKDQMTPLKYALFLQNKLSQAELKIVKGGTHMVFAEHPDLVNKTIQGFLTSI